MSTKPPTPPTPSKPTAPSGGQGAAGGDKPPRVNVYAFTVKRKAVMQIDPEGGDLIDVVSQSEDDAMEVIKKLYGDDLGHVEGGGAAVTGALLSPNASKPETPQPAKTDPENQPTTPQQGATPGQGSSVQGTSTFDSVAKKK